MGQLRLQDCAKSHLEITEVVQISGSASGADQPAYKDSFESLLLIYQIFLQLDETIRNCVGREKKALRIALGRDH